MFSHTFAIFLIANVFAILSFRALYLPPILLHLHNKFRTMRNFFLNVLGVRAHYLNFASPLTARQTPPIGPSGHTRQT